VERPAGMPRQPLAHLGMLVGRIIVDDGMDHFSHRDLLFDRIEEADELLVAMVLYVAAEDGAIENFEGCEQRGSAVTFVVVRHRPGAARLHRQSRLGAVERLDLAHMGIRGSRSTRLISWESPVVASYPGFEPSCMIRPVSDAASNSHLVGCTNIPLASDKGSGGRDHSLLRLFEPGQISVRSPGSARADEALGD
jgi:hypothetical protein